MSVFIKSLVFLFLELHSFHCDNCLLTGFRFRRHQKPRAPQERTSKAAASGAGERHTQQRRSATYCSPQFTHSLGILTPRSGNKLFLLAPFFLLCHDSRLGLAGRRPQSANQDGTRKVFTVTRQKSSGRQSLACTFYPGDARGCGQGGARAGPHRPGRQKTAHPSAPRLARSDHRDLWGGPPTANQGPRGAHSFTNAAGKEARVGPELRGTLKHPRVLWCLGWSSGGPDRRKLDACRGCPFADYRSFPAIWAWRTILPGPAVPGSAPAPAGPAGRPEPAGSLSAQKEAAPGRVPGVSLRQ